MWSQKIKFWELVFYSLLNDSNALNASVLCGNKGEFVWDTSDWNFLVVLEKWWEPVECELVISESKVLERSLIEWKVWDPYVIRKKGHFIYWAVTFLDKRNRLCNGLHFGLIEVPTEVELENNFSKYVYKTNA